MDLADLVNTEFHTTASEPCWAFCQQVFHRLGQPMPSHISELQRIESPQIGAVVLLWQGHRWHAGVVWPDCLHFIHARPPLNAPNGKIIGGIDSLFNPLYKPFIDGYYVYEGEGAA